MNEEKVQPLKLTDTETNVTYTLDFNRDSIRFAEAHQFKLDDVSDYPVTKIPEFFYYAFRMHHKNLSRTQTDKILEALGGLSTAVADRLVSLYAQVIGSNNIVQDDEALEKNSRITVEL